MKENDLPLLIHSGQDDISSAMNIYKLAKKEPDLRVCAAHMGRFNKFFFEALLKEPLPNLYVDLSPFLNFHGRLSQPSRYPNYPEISIDRKNPLTALRYLYEILPNNLIWGTDSPYSHTASLEDKVEKITCYRDESELLRRLEKPIINKIASQNTIRFLFGRTQKIKSR